MRMSKKEKEILLKVCKESNIDPNLLRNIYLTESEYYFTNQSRKNALIQDIIKEIRAFANTGDK